MSSKRLFAVVSMLVVLIGSVYAAISVEQSIINIDPNPMDKSTTITVTFAVRVTAEILIETESGILVKTLYTGNLDSGVYEFFWNRMSDEGAYVPNGKYSVTVNYDYRYTSTKKTLILK